MAGPGAVRGFFKKQSSPAPTLRGILSKVHSP